MASPEAVSRQMGRATRKLEIVAERQGNEDQLLAFHQKVQQPTYGDEIAGKANALEAAADLIASSLGIEIEEEELDDAAGMGKYNAMNPSVPFERQRAGAGQGPVPEDAEPGAAMTDAQAEGTEAASPQSEEEREALTAHEAERDAPAATPGAVKAAEEHGVDLASVRGSGDNGKILKGDVEAEAERREAAASADQDEDADEGEQG